MNYSSGARLEQLWDAYHSFSSKDEWMSCVLVTLIGVSGDSTSPLNQVSPLPYGGICSLSSNWAAVSILSAAL